MGIQRETMFIKFKFNNITRKVKLSEDCTIEALKESAEKLFGSEAKNCDYLYEDSDSELVSIVETADVVTCFEETNELGKRSAVVILKPANASFGVRARSISQKKKVEKCIRNQAKDLAEKEFMVVNSNTSSSEDTDELEQSTASIKDEIKTVDKIMDKFAKKIEEKKAKKIAKLEKKFKEQQKKLEKKLAKQEKKREDKRNKHKHNRGRFGGRGHCKGKGRGMPEFVKLMIEQKQSYEAETDQKWPKLRTIFRDFKESHPEFRRNPHLNAKLLESVGPKITELLNAEAEKLKQEHADLIEQGEKNREAIRAKREEFIAQKQ